MSSLSRVSWIASRGSSRHALHVLLVSAAVLAPPYQSESPRLLASLDRYVRTTLSQAERRALAAGGLVTKLLDSEPGKEMAVLGIVWINAPPAAYVDLVKDIEHFENGGAFLMTRRISDPPRLDDFAELDLPDDDLNDLRNCRVGDCEVKLSAEALHTLRGEVDWNTPTAKADARRAFRRLALEYVNGYREGGNAELAVYRDKNRPTFVAREFRSMIERVPAFSTSLADLRRFLLEYPRASLPDSTDFLYWQETRFGLKPTIRISHLVVQQRPEETVVASKMLYASHYFWTALELRILLPDPARGAGFWLVTVNRSRSDGLSGFIGVFARGRIRNEVREGTLAVLKATKARLES